MLLHALADLRCPFLAGFLPKADAAHPSAVARQLLYINGGKEMAETQNAHRVRLALSFEEAIERTVHELAEQGFGVVTWVDLRDKLIERLGADVRSYVIMGVFDPELAQRALALTIDIGLVLPLNVIVYESEPGRSVVAALVPEAGFSVLGNDPELIKLARDAGSRLRLVVQALDSDNRTS